MLPFENSGALKSRFGFVVTNSHLDLSPTGIGQDHIPGILGVADGLIGKHDQSRDERPPARKVGDGFYHRQGWR